MNLILSNNDAVNNHQVNFYDEFKFDRDQRAKISRLQNPLQDATRTKNFQITPNQIDKLPITYAEKAVLRALYRLRDIYKTIDHTYEQIAEATGCVRSTAAKAIRTLRGIGAIIVQGSKKDGKRRNIYEINDKDNQNYKLDTIEKMKEHLVRSTDSLQVNHKPKGIKIFNKKKKAVMTENQAMIEIGKMTRTIGNLEKLKGIGLKTKVWASIHLGIELINPYLWLMQNPKRVKNYC